MGQLENMSVFIRVVEAGGISKAADQLGLAKSAVSRRLLDLESALGVKLLNRTTRRSSLTEPGKHYYQRAMKILDDVAELNSMTVDTNAALSGTLHLAAPLSFGLAHLSTALDIFAREHPDLTIHVDFSDRHIDIIEEGFDLAFRIGKLKSSSLQARKISPVNIVVCASTGYLKKYGTPQSPDDLKNHKLLHYGNSGSGIWKIMGPDKKEYTVTAPQKFVANNGDFLRDMAIAGHGIVITPTFISWQALATGDLLPVLSEYTVPQQYAYAVYPQTRYLSRRTRVLIDFLVERFGDNPYWDQSIC